MSQHPAVLAAVERIRAHGLCGLSEVTRETVQALLQVVQDSPASDPAELADGLEAATMALLRVMPSFAPSIHGMHLMLACLEQAIPSGTAVAECKASLAREVRAFCDQAESAIEQAARFGAEKIRDDSIVLMSSLTPVLWHVLRLARSRGKLFSVVVPESRPGTDGPLVLTEMVKAGIQATAILDASVGEIAPECDVVLAGGHAVSSDGVSLCRVGTYPAALVARMFSIPFYVVADTYRFDPGTLIGLPFRALAIARDHVVSDEYAEHVQITGHWHDQTPPQLVTAIITEMGFLNPAACASLMWRVKRSERLSAILRAWARDEFR